MDNPPAASLDKTKKRSVCGTFRVRDGEYYGDVVLSLQAGVGRKCTRRTEAVHSGDLRPFSHVEVALIGPDDALTIPSALGLPKALDVHFPDRRDVVVSGPLSWRAVNELRRALLDRCDRLGRFDPS